MKPSSASQPELGHRTPLGRLAHPCRLGGYERLEVHDVEQRCFQQLTFHDRTHDAHQGLVREHRGALFHAVDIRPQAQRAQMLEERGFEQRTASGSLQRSQIGDILFGEAIVLHQLGQLRHAASDSVSAFEGVIAEVHDETGFLDLAAHPLALPVALGHGDLVQIGEQRKIPHFHSVPSFSSGSGFLSSVVSAGSDGSSSASRSPSFKGLGG